MSTTPCPMCQFCRKEGRRGVSICRWEHEWAWVQCQGTQPWGKAGYHLTNSIKPQHYRAGMWFCWICHCVFGSLGLSLASFYAVLTYSSLIYSLISSNHAGSSSSAASVFFHVLFLSWLRLKASVYQVWTLLTFHEAGCSSLLALPQSLWHSLNKSPICSSD